jgi:hypothetical protein
MLWHGKKSNSLFFKKNSNKYQSKQLKKKLFQLPKRLQNQKLSFSVYIPSSWEVIIICNFLKNKQYLYIYSKTYFLVLPLPTYKRGIAFNTNCSLFTLNTLYTNVYSRLLFKTFYSYLTIFSLPIFKKLKFKGKGYYIYKNYRNTVTPQFGHSHRIYVYSFFTSIKFLSKTSILLFGINKSDICKSSQQIKQLRPINIFTGRGVRFSKQIIYKKAGKISTYR